MQDDKVRRSIRTYYCAWNNHGQRGWYWKAGEKSDGPFENCVFAYRAAEKALELKALGLEE